ncbi:MAG: toll/interleukin-1 receptor domain-containing protein [Bacteroidales bacterium]|nr:toll/interleukin-1 receptor domain-containing protein [Bacteroidales bacterium]
MAEEKKYLGFVSYSHSETDNIYFDTLISGLQRHSQKSKFWTDKEIPSASKWRDEIFEKLKQADFAILLISPNFLSSEFIMNTEFPEILKLHKKKFLKVFPILLSPVDIDKSPTISEIQFYIIDRAKYDINGPQNKMYSYAHLVNLLKGKNEIQPNRNREQFHIDFINYIESKIKNSDSADSNHEKNQAKRKSFNLSTVKEIAISYASEYNKANCYEDKVELLTVLIDLLIEHDKTKREVIEKFINHFNQGVKPNIRSLIIASEIDLYEILIKLFKNGIPSEPHFLNEINSKYFFINPLYAYILSIIKDIEQSGYSTALVNIESIPLRLADYECFYADYLVGQINRKNNELANSLTHFSNGIKKISSRSFSVPNKYCRSSCQACSVELIGAELFRGRATIYRKLLASASEPDEVKYYSLANSDYKQALSLFNKINPVKHTKPKGSEAVGSDIYFSYGYFKFENYFKKLIKSQETDEKDLKLALKLFDLSNNLNSKFTPPLSRAGIIYLYNKDYFKAGQYFNEVKTKDHVTENTTNGELILTSIWIDFALFYINKITYEKYNVKNPKTLLEFTISSFRTKNISKGAIDCHTFDLKVIFYILGVQNQPIIENEFNEILAIFNLQNNSQHNI